jgi:hypothetical protein
MITITGSEQPLHDTGKHILQPRHWFTHVTSNLKKRVVKTCYSL